MAEPFSIATGAIQVASAGIALAKTLYEYLESVKSANKHIKAIAVEVRLTSSVLEQLGRLLEETETEKLCSNNIVTDAKAAFSGCEDAFREVDEAVKVLVKPPTNGGRNVSLSASLFWPFKKGKLEALQANLERLKTTLLLMLSVLGYARDKAAKSAATETQSAIERLQIQNLIKAKDDATERYERLALDFSHLQTAPQGISILNRSIDYRSSTYQSNAYIPQQDLATVRLTASASTMVPPANHATHSPDYNALLLQLDMCSSALWRLTSAINTASWNLRVARTYEPKGVSESYHDLQTAIEALLAMEGNHAQSGKATLPQHNYAYTPKPPFYDPQAAAQVLQRPSAPVQPPSNALKPYHILEDEGEALDGQDIEGNALNKAGEMTGGVEEEMQLPGLVTDASQLVGKELSEAAEGVEEGVLKGIEFRDGDVLDLSDMHINDMHIYDFNQSISNAQLSPRYLCAMGRNQHSGHNSPGRQRSNITQYRPDPPTNKDGKYICTASTDCAGQMFDRKCEWNKHMDKHDRPYRCAHPDCSKSQGFTYSGGLLRHEREIHGKHGGPKSSIMCPYPNCKRNDKGFTRQEYLKEHIRRVHSKESQVQTSDFGESELHRPQDYLSPSPVAATSSNPGTTYGGFLSPSGSTPRQPPKFSTQQAFDDPFAQYEDSNRQDRDEPDQRQSSPSPTVHATFDQTSHPPEPTGPKLGRTRPAVGARHQILSPYENSKDIPVVSSRSKRYFAGDVEDYSTRKHVRTEEPWTADTVEDLVRRWTTVEV